MLSTVLESSHPGRDTNVESLFHTYCLIELRTSLALECKSLELNLDELRKVWGLTTKREIEGGNETRNIRLKTRVRGFELPSEESL